MTAVAPIPAAPVQGTGTGTASQETVVQKPAQGPGEAGHPPPHPMAAPPLAPFRQGLPPLLRPADDEAEARAITRSTVQAAMEVLAGIRPVHQLARRLDPRCLAALQHRAALIRRELTRTGNPALARLHRNATVRSVRVCEVSDGVYEASAVVLDDVRARAVAVRLERSKQVWRITELVIG